MTVGDAGIIFKQMKMNSLTPIWFKEQNQPELRSWKHQMSGVDL